MIKVGDTLTTSIGPANNFLGNYPKVEVVEIFDNIVAYRYQDDPSTANILFMLKKTWIEKAKEQN